MINCNLSQINRVKHSIPLKIDTHTHTYCELTYFVSGNGSTEINGKNYNYNSGDFAFYKAGTPHNEYDPTPCDIIWLHFNFDISDIDLNEGVYEDCEGRLFSLLQKIRSLSFENNLHNRYLTECCLGEIIITAHQLQSKNFTVAKTANHINWKKILNYIDSNINEPVNFQDLAKSYNYSYDRFRHLFYEHFGTSPYSYLTKQRIRHAEHLLKNSNSHITDIAFDCGFNSASQFTNIFKKYTGLTPKEYKNNL